MTENNKQVKSKQRVADHGEVYTAEREVNAMLDLVKQETERIDSRFLEPACGDGNFLAEILRRKLAVVKSRYKRNALDYERYAVVAASSIYGVDILQDNVEECRARMFAIWDKEYTTHCKEMASNDCRDAVRFIFQRNVLCGNVLTLLDANDQPIIFSEWSLVTGSLMKRRDFKLNQLMEGTKAIKDTNNNLYENLLAQADGWEYDEEIKGYIPAPIREYPLIDYRRLHHE